MTDYDVTTRIDTEKCNGCGRCIEVCPAETLSMKDGKARVTGTTSLSCGQCMAVCPEGAIQVEGIDPASIAFETFEMDREWLPWGGADVKDLARIIASRRSCRRYRTRPVEMVVLKDLVKLGCLAPSGSNCQNWTFTVLSTRQQVEDLGRIIGGFYKQLNRMAEKPFLRNIRRLLGKPDLFTYYHRYYDKVKRAIREMEEEGRDRLFHGAAAAILVGTHGESTSPAEDALLATQNILLGAHAMGLGTCLIGYAVKALEQDHSLQEQMGIPASETVHSVIALGYPKTSYRTITGRKPAVVRYP